ncbi:hypothetical protein [Myxosarcina sp. GI1(2024)]
MERVLRDAIVLPVLLPMLFLVVVALFSVVAAFLDVIFHER